MQKLDKILEDIDAIKYESDYKLSAYSVRGIKDILINRIKDIVRNHMNDGWISVEDERLWDILFEEACVEGEQARRIYNKLKKTFGRKGSEIDEIF